MSSLTDSFHEGCFAVFGILLRICGPVCFMFVQYSMFKTALLIRKQQSIGEFSVIPFLSLFSNASVWAMYGFIKCDKTILIPNTTGLFVGLYCTMVFHTHIDGKDEPHHLYLISFLVIMVSFFLAGQGDVENLGCIGVVMSVLLMGSPLSTVYKVLQEKSTASMPFGTSLFNFCNALSWTLFGYLIDHDALLYVSSGIGLILCSLQLTLFFIYGLPPTGESHAANESTVIVYKKPIILSPLLTRNIYSYTRIHQYQSPLHSIDEISGSRSYSSINV